MMNIRVLVIGDVVGSPGQEVFQKHIRRLKQEYDITAIIVNGENSADGRGITPKIMQFFKHHGVTAVTSGNHIWQKREILPYFNEHKDLLRPANFPSACPGSGVGLFTCGDIHVGIINVQGSVFMREHLSCPFKAIESALTYLKSRTPIIIVDMHAEATSEKKAVAWFFDGQISALIGTHTHVQTADETILPNGTAFLSDVGMCGACNSILGMKPDGIIRHMQTQMPTKFEVATEGPLVLGGVVVDIDRATGHATRIERILLIDKE